MSLHVEIVPVLADNYVFILKCMKTGEVAVVDPGEAGPVLKALGDEIPEKILLTHHHHDHVGGVEELVAMSGAEVYGSLYDADRERLPMVSHTLKEGDKVTVGACEAVVLETPGHTRGHISYHFASENLLFCGDTLFIGGCGRLLEGTAEEMFGSLGKIAALPDETAIYCAHEYTLANLAFAESVRDKVSEPSLVAKAHQRARDKRAQHLPTVPGLLSEERRTNVFLRAETRETFADLRQRKDAF